MILQLLIVSLISVFVRGDAIPYQCEEACMQTNDRIASCENKMGELEITYTRSTALETYFVKLMECIDNIFAKEPKCISCVSVVIEDDLEILLSWQTLIKTSSQRRFQEAGNAYFNFTLQRSKDLEVPSFLSQLQNVKLRNSGNSNALNLSWLLLLVVMMI